MKDFVQRFQVAQLQQALLGMGHDAGPIDGLAGKQTAEALHSALADLTGATPATPAKPIGPVWPRDTLAEMVKFFGEPADHSRMGLLELPNPLRLYSQSGPIVESIYCHKLVHEPLYTALEALGKLDPQVIRDNELDVTAGCFSHRAKRGSSSLSTHSWGVAIDLAPNNNPWKAVPTMPAEAVKCFTDQGAEWGGAWPNTPDGMHFQFCRSFF